MLIENKQIAIVGGGPGGLTLACLLQTKGVAVTVYERDHSRKVRVQGATLDLHHESGLKALAAAGLIDVFKKTYRPGADKGRVLDKHANILFDEHAEETGKDFGNEVFRPEIDRGDLRNMLLDSLKPDTVVWDSHLINILPEGNGWKLEFKNGNVFFADLVVGADGAGSKIRPLVTASKALYADMVILHFNIDNGAINAPAMHQLVHGGKIYVYDDGKSLHISAKGDGSIDFYIGMKVKEDWASVNAIHFSDKEHSQEWFRKEFAGWNESWFELFDNTSSPVAVRPQYFAPLDQTWEAQSNITLLGDAAHLMPPSGEGVNLAMLDALELCECLTGHDFENTESAIAFYENNMRVRAVAEELVALDMVKWMHEEGGTNKIISLFKGEWFPGNDR